MKIAVWKAAEMNTLEILNEQQKYHMYRYVEMNYLLADGTEEKNISGKKEIQWSTGTSIVQS